MVGVSITVEQMFAKLCVDSGILKVTGHGSIEFVQGDGGCLGLDSGIGRLLLLLPVFTRRLVSC